MTYRRIDVAGEARRAGPSGTAPDLEWVPVSALVINEAYQRPIEGRGWRTIRRIAENFDWGRFSPLLVSRIEGGAFAVIDGQHRSHAAAICGIEAVPALVVDLTEQEQAAAFSWVNGTVTQLTQHQIYRAALAALEPWALQCEAAVKRAGCRLMTANASAKDKQGGEVYCIKLIRDIVERGAGVYLVAGLGGLRQSASRDEPYFYGYIVLRAIVSLAESQGVTRPEVIASFLDAHELWDVDSRVHRLRQREEFRHRPFAGLFADSLRVLFRQWRAEAA